MISLGTKKKPLVFKVPDGLYQYGLQEEVCVPLWVLDAYTTVVGARR